ASPSASKKGPYTAWRGASSRAHKACTSGSKPLPDTRTMPTAPRPGAVATATMGLFRSDHAIVAIKEKAPILAHPPVRGASRTSPYSPTSPQLLEWPEPDWWAQKDQGGARAQLY